MKSVASGAFRRFLYGANAQSINGFLRIVSGYWLLLRQDCPVDQFCYGHGACVQGWFHDISSSCHFTAIPGFHPNLKGQSREMLNQLSENFQCHLFRRKKKKLNTTGEN